MGMWLVIMFVGLLFTAVSLLYLKSRVEKFSPVNVKNKSLISSLIVVLIFSVIGISLNFINAIICAIYFAMIWCICDLVFGRIKKSYKHYYAGWVATILSIIILSCGWYLGHNVWKTEYNIITQKSIPNLKIAMFADSHLGTTFNADGFAKHLETIASEKPDILVIAGDFVDDDTTKEDMLRAVKYLGKFKTKYGIYFAFGNHDKGYYGPAYRGFSGQDLISELEKNNIIVLRDEIKPIADKFYIIGRKDYSVEREQHGKRKSMYELVAGLNKNEYTIVIDHQPTDYENQAKSNVDLVLSGHTHGGQLFPFNNVGKWIGANDRVYGYEKRNNSNFIVTSGISDWAIKFKTGTKSEFVIINITKGI